MEAAMSVLRRHPSDFPYQDLFGVSSDERAVTSREDVPRMLQEEHGSAMRIEIGPASEHLTILTRAGSPLRRDHPSPPSFVAAVYYASTNPTPSLATGLLASWIHDSALSTAAGDHPQILPSIQHSRYVSMVSLAKSGAIAFGKERSKAMKHKRLLRQMSALTLR
jgi:hypothetical protein